MDKQIKEEIAAIRAFYARRRADRADHTFGWPVITHPQEARS